MHDRILQQPIPKNKDCTRRSRKVTIPTLFQLIIQCRDEAQQRELYEQLTVAGYVCKVMTL